MACICGHPAKKPLTLAEIRQWSKLRGRRINVCPLCRHEVMQPENAHDVRKISAFGTNLAHAVCVRAHRLPVKRPPATAKCRGLVQSPPCAGPGLSAGKGGE